MRTFVLVASLAALSTPATPALAEAPKLTLEATIAKALVGPRARMGASSVDVAEARLGEAKALRLPRIKATLFGTISPEIDCLDPACTRTDPTNFAFRYDGLWGGGQLDITQPLYRFGASSGFSAAKAGIAAERYLSDEVAGDVAVDASRAYWGLKLAREPGFMLDDGIEEIEKARERMNARTGADEPTLEELQRIEILVAEAQLQRADATAGERQALAGLRAITGIADADIGDEALEAVPFALPATSTGDRRPQALAAREGARAADALAAFTAGAYYPDLSLVGRVFAARAQGVTDPPSIFANDPYNGQGVNAVLQLSWTLEPWSVRARVQRAHAEARRARALSELAAAGAQYDAATALAEAGSAKSKLEAAARGEKAGRAWIVSLLQADAIGTVEAKDFADAYLAWFRMRASWAQAAFQWNVAVTRLARANGEFRAKR